ncbi:hypothetical protein PDQ79_23510 [Bacillus cereus]|uniref:Uncharacterized protein n=1 Tax=Bacillus fungorum TaxID=2039284 RepID=A0A2G6Q7H2_9BACI|nr:hypothetical protein [Bacillus fungorum]MDA2637469.1 hypothetical protein [Bacillus cereus]PIE92767.1 hypothetical protein CO726_24690 [Bacillus fungorum]
MNEMGIKLFLAKAKIGESIIISYHERRNSLSVSGDIVKIGDNSVTVKEYVINDLYRDVEIPFKNIWYHSLECQPVPRSM